MNKLKSYLHTLCENAIDTFEDKLVNDDVQEYVDDIKDIVSELKTYAKFDSYANGVLSLEVFVENDINLIEEILSEFSYIVQSYTVAHEDGDDDGSLNTGLFIDIFLDNSAVYFDEALDLEIQNLLSADELTESRMKYVVHFGKTGNKAIRKVVCGRGMKHDHITNACIPESGTEKFRRIRGAIKAQKTFHREGASAELRKLRMTKKSLNARRNLNLKRR